MLEFRCGWVGVVSVLQAEPSSGACDYSVELPHWSYCSWFDVRWSFGVVGLEWYPCCRLNHHQELATILLNYHIGRIVLSSMCVGVSV